MTAAARRTRVARDVQSEIGRIDDQLDQIAEAGADMKRQLEGLQSEGERLEREVRSLTADDDFDDLLDRQEEIRSEAEEVQGQAEDLIKQGEDLERARAALLDNMTIDYDGVGGTSFDADRDRTWFDTLQDAFKNALIIQTAMAVIVTLIAALV